LAQALGLAAAAVAKVRAGGSLGTAPLANGVDPAIRAQVQDLAYGSLRRFGWGDAILHRLLRQPLSEPVVHALLLVTLYRLDSRPDATHTIVDQAVSAVPVLTRRDLRGLVNGVLRSYLRASAQLNAEVNSNETVRWALPDWWLRRLQRAWPADWRQIATTASARSPMCLRVNRRQGTSADYAEELTAAGIAVGRIEGDALWLVDPVAVDRLPGFFSGRCSVQDAGAQRAADLLGATGVHRVLDACAAPGGKTTHLLELGAETLLALDSDASRIARIEENLQRLGLSAEVRVADAARSDRWWDGQAYDRILADVPCSASGVVRRHPDAKWLRRDEDIAGFVGQQRRLLNALWQVLAPGGRLLYATCSIFPEENAGQIDGFCASNPDAIRVPIGGAPGLQLLPNADHDGFYYALLEKRR
jgi:16S rRNA (cytosine967-C5)-methyltransferase